MARPHIEPFCDRDNHFKPMRQAHGLEVVISIAKRFDMGLSLIHI